MSLINCDNKYVIDTDTIDVSVTPVNPKETVTYNDDPSHPRVIAFETVFQPIAKCEYYLIGQQDKRCTITVKLPVTGRAQCRESDKYERMLFESYDSIDITKYKSDDILTELNDAIKTQLDTDQKENQFFADERRLNTHFQKLVKELQK